MTGGLHLALVRMGGRSCAIPCSAIVEIVPRVELRAVPDAPPGVLGAMNLRGRVVPVVDIRSRVAESDVSETPYQHLVVVEHEGRRVGLAVDEVKDVFDVSPDAIERPAELAGRPGPGVVRVDEELVVVLRPEDAVHVPH